MKTTFEQFTKFMTNLKKTLPKYAPDLEQSTVALWFDALSTIEVEDLRKIYKHCIDNLDAFPSIKLIKELSSVDDDDNLPKDPFGELIRAVQTRNYDRYPAVQILSRRLGGYDAIGEWQIEYHDAKRRMVDGMWKQIVQDWKMTKQQTALPPRHVMEIMGLKQ